MASLEELLLNDLQETGVFDLAASVGIVQHGRLQGGGRPEEAWPPPPPLGASVPQQVPQQVPDHGMDAEELHAANESVAACLRAAEAASVALRLTDLQLAQWSAGGPPEAGSLEGAPLPSPTAPNRLTAAAAAAAAEGSPAEAGSAETPSGAAPPAAAAGLPKRKRATRGGAAAAAAAAASSAASDMFAAPGGLLAAAGGAAAGARKEPLGKASALRHFSMKVCEKVESKVDTSYEEVANELIADIAAEVAAGTAEAATDEKNIRRRCYDALNVLEAIGMITKTKKSIRWKGWPTGLGRSAEERLRAERVRAMERLDQKRQLLEDAIQKCYCLSNLVSRNHAVPLPVLLGMQESGQRVPNPLKLPFILVRTDQGAELHVDISSDNLHANIDFGSWPFAILDDDQVMKLLDLQHPSPLLESALQQQQHQVESQLAAQRAQQAAAAQQAQQAEQQRQAAAAAALQQVRQAQQQQQPVARLLPQLVAGAPPSLRPQKQSSLPPAASNQQPQLVPAGAPVAPAPSGPQAAGQPGRLQLSQAIGSPAAAAAGLGSIVSAMELGSPPAGAARAAAGARASSDAAFVAAAAAAAQQQQAQLQQGGAPMLAPAGGVKLEPGAPALAEAGAAANAAVPPHLQLAAGWPVMGGYLGGPAAQQQQQVPLLRPAAAATLQQFQQQQQQQQQVQQQPQVQPHQAWQQQQQAQQPMLRPAVQAAPTLHPAQPPR